MLYMLLDNKHISYSNFFDKILSIHHPVVIPLIFILIWSTGIAVITGDLMWMRKTKEAK